MMRVIFPVHTTITTLAVLHGHVWFFLFGTFMTARTNVVVRLHLRRWEIVVESNLKYRLLSSAQLVSAFNGTRKSKTIQRPIRNAERMNQKINKNKCVLPKFSSSKYVYRNGADNHVVFLFSFILFYECIS